MATEPRRLSDRTANVPIVDPATGRATNEFTRWLNDLAQMARKAAQDPPP